VDPFGSARDLIRPGDVLTSIDTVPIADDGTLSLDGDVVLFPEIIERKQWGDTITLGVRRGGKATTLTVPLKNLPDPFIFRREYDRRPRYFIHGGLVFAPLDRAKLSAVKDSLSDPTAHQLHYYADFAKIDGLYEGRDEFVLLAGRLPHAVNAYAGAYRNGIVETVNGRKVKNLEEVKQALEAQRDGFHLVRFAGNEDELVLDAAQARQAHPEILRAYAIAEPEYFGPLDRE
jgi:hypothetical protein